VRFIPPSTGNYTITTEALFDSYLYLLDPRSAEPMERDIGFNDDYNGTHNSSISRILEANIPYLVIYTKYNPSTPFSDYDSGDDLVLKISL